MKKLYFTVVVATVGAHFAYLIYLPSGGFLALRWPRHSVVHAACVAWGIGVVCLHLPCPLTWLEQWARGQAGMNTLPATGFIDRYVAGVLYPSHRTGFAQALAFGAALLSWLLLAARHRGQPVDQEAVGILTVSQLSSAACPALRCVPAQWDSVLSPRTGTRPIPRGRDR